MPTTTPDTSRDVFDRPTQRLDHFGRPLSRQALVEHNTDAELRAQATALEQAVYTECGRMMAADQSTQLASKYRPQFGVQMVAMAGTPGLSQQVTSPKAAWLRAVAEVLVGNDWVWFVNEYPGGAAIHVSGKARP